MQTGANSGSVSFWHSGKAKLLLGVCPAVLVLACAVPAEAAEYTASNAAELAAAINLANTNGDTNAVIKLTASFDVQTLPKPNNALTIDTQGFTLSGIDNTAPLGDGGDILFSSGTGGTVTLSGTFVGGDAGPTSGNGGGSALNMNSGTLASSIINNGTLTGGAGGQSKPGGVAVTMNVTTFVNNGTITGGGNTLGGTGNSGVQVRRGSTLTNNANALIQGGTSQSSFGGVGVDIGGPGAASTLINHGMIRGATGATGSGVAVFVRTGTNPITNTGTLEGGNGAIAVITTGNANLSLTNSGTIRAGTGQATAITLAAGSTGFLTLELREGSEISGNVIANATAKTDILRLGGDANDTFDASAIGTQYQNFNIFEKTGASTWTLTGTTTALTPWQLKAGTLAVSSDGALGDAAGALTFDGGTLRALSSFTSSRNMVFTGNGVFDVDAGAELTLSGSLTGAGGLRKLGAGTLIQNSAVVYSGATSVEGGTLRAGGAGIFSGNYSISPVTGATLDLGGFDQSIAALTHGGALRFGDVPGTTLTVTGNYVGNGGTLHISTALGDDHSDTDLLRVNVGTSGNTLVRVTNVGGAGAQTQEGIKIIDVVGSSAGTFALIGDTIVNGQQAVLGGAFAYSLLQGSVSAPGDGDWYLRSIGFTPSASAYESYPAILLGLIDMPTFQQRIGNSYMPNAGSGRDGYVNPEPAADVVAPEPVKLANFWTRIEAGTGHYEGESDTGTEYDLDRYRAQVGFDGRLGESEEGILIAGINAQYGSADADLSSDNGKGSNKTDSYGGGLSLTWLGTSGFYADAQAMAHYFESDLKSSVLGDLAEDNEGWGYGVSLELGRKLALADAWSITPQAQLAYTSVDFDGFTDAQGVDISLDEGESLKGRLGVALGFDSNDGGDSRGHVYTIANLTYEFLDAPSVDVAGTDVEFEPEDFGGELGLGGAYEWAEGKYSIHGEALGQTSFEGSYGIKGTAGFSAKF